jgi:hypothetical protein
VLTPRVDKRPLPQNQSDLRVDRQQARNTKWTDVPRPHWEDEQRRRGGCLAKVHQPSDSFEVISGIPTHFRPERAKARLFQQFPPPLELFEIVPLSPDMELDEQLAKGQWQVLLLVGPDQRLHRGVLRAFDVDLQNVDEFVAYVWTMNDPPTTEETSRDLDEPFVSKRD